MIKSYQSGKTRKASAKIKNMAKNISPSDVTHFATTKHKGLPKKVKEAAEQFKFYKGMPRVPFGSEKSTYLTSKGESCPDCGAKRGEYHEVGCESEEHPKTHDQLGDATISAYYNKQAGWYENMRKDINKVNGHYSPEEFKSMTGINTKEAFERGFFKAALANGVDPVAAVQLMKVSFDANTTQEAIKHMIPENLSELATPGLIGAGAGALGGGIADRKHPIQGALGGAALGGLGGLGYGMYNTGANAFNTDKADMSMADSKGEHLINNAIRPGQTTTALSAQLEQLLARQKGVNHSSFLGALTGHKNPVSNDMMTRDQFSGDDMPAPKYRGSFSESITDNGGSPDQYINQLGSDHRRAGTP